MVKGFVSDQAPVPEHVLLKTGSRILEAYSDKELTTVAELMAKWCSNT